MQLRILAAAVAASALTALGVAVGVSAQNGTPAASSSDSLFAALAGDNEVDSPGDSDGRGSFSATVVGKKKLCFGLAVKKIGKPLAAHIHTGAKGRNGDVVVTLAAPKDGAGGGIGGCTTAPAATIADILGSPKRFYVNVHTADFGGGAIRGQLFAKAP
jgi:CHRD domain